MKRNLLFTVILVVLSVVGILPAEADEFTYSSVEPAAESVLTKSSSGYASMSFKLTFDRTVSVANYRAAISLHKETVDGATENPDDSWSTSLSGDKKSLTVFGQDYDGYTQEFYVNKDKYYLVIPAGTVKDASGNTNAQIVIKYYGSQAAKDADKPVIYFNPISYDPADSTELSLQSGYASESFSATFSETPTVVDITKVKLVGSKNGEIAPDDEWKSRVSGNKVTFWGADYDGFTMTFKADTGAVYTLTIPAGTFKNASGDLNEEQILHFFGPKKAAEPQVEDEDTIITTQQKGTLKT